MPKKSRKKKKLIVWIKEVGRGDIGLVGGKGANLGEMLRANIPVPNGFIVTADTYFDFLDKTALRSKIKTELRGLNVDDSKKLLTAAKRIQKAILAAKMPKKTADAIKKYYHELSGKHDQETAVRSSATAEDLPEASFAGQQETYLNVKGAKDVIESVQKCWASLFEPRAIFYRTDKGFDHLEVGIAVPVQEMVPSEVSGVMFTLDPITNDKTKISIEAAYGLGQTVVSGSLTPDQYLVEKKTLKILDKKVVSQTWQLVKKGKVKISRDYQKRQKLPDKFIVELAGISKRIENHYKFPQDIEWAFANNTLKIVQTRPVTTIKVGEKSGVASFVQEADLVVLLEGLAASPGIASGPVKKIISAEEIDKVKKGDILVTEMTTPDFVPAMRRAVAIVTNAGGRTSHAAIVSRELGIPCIVGTEQATKMLKTGEIITVDGSGGKIYEGELQIQEAEVETVKKKTIKIKTATKVYVNLAEPELAADIAGKNVDGVGLLRAEFMVAGIGTHPRKLLEQGKEKVFIHELAEGMAKFCKAFRPRPVVYRATDFKTNEYKNLKGGEEYEKDEPNPMIGFRGCYRYIKDDDVFNLELEAIKNVRNKRGYRNLYLMVPFIHTVEELIEVKKLIAASGLARGGSFKLWMMVELPSNVILLDDFIKVGIDGVSIGTNDLTMLTLGVDRDNPQVAKVYDERNPAVLWSLKRIVEKCHKHEITCSICGQAPSDYPELTEKLVKWGITSVSINPDVIDKTREIIYKVEKELVKGKK